MARPLDRMRVGTKLTPIAFANAVPIGIALRQQSSAIDFATRVDAKREACATSDSELAASLPLDNASSCTKARSQLSVSTLQREWDQPKTSTDAAREPAVAASVTNFRRSWRVTRKDSRERAFHRDLVDCLS
jgi:hypothetical protein